MGFRIESTDGASNVCPWDDNANGEDEGGDCDDDCEEEEGEDEEDERLPSSQSRLIVVNYEREEKERGRRRTGNAATEEKKLAKEWRSRKFRTPHPHTRLYPQIQSQTRRTEPLPTSDASRTPRRDGSTNIALNVAQHNSPAAIHAPRTRTPSRVPETRHKHEHRTPPSTGFWDASLTGVGIGVDCGDGGTAYVADFRCLEVA